MAEEVQPPTLAELVAAMQKGDSTNGWDIVTFYSVDALNQVLANSHADGRLVTELKFQEDIEDPFEGDKRTIAYDLWLGVPQLAFLGGQSGTCTLSMPITSGPEGQPPTYTVSKPGGTPRNVQIKSGYTIVATVPVAAISGDLDAATSGTVVNFDNGDDNGDKVHICLHFKSGVGTGTIYQLLPIPGPDDKEAMDIIFMPLVKKHFEEQVSEIDYMLTGMTNTPSQPARGIIATPKSFVFATDTSVLGIYVQTKQSGSPQGDRHPSFQPGGHKVLPIPQGSTASVVFARQFVWEKYVKPGLTDLTNPKVDDSAPNGIRVTFTTNTPTFRHNAGHGGRSELKIDTLTVPFAEIPYAIWLNNNQINVTWNFSQNLSWRLIRTTRDNETIKTDGQTQVYIRIDKSMALSNLDSDQFDLSFQIQPSDYSGGSDDRSDWLHDPGGVMDGLAGAVQQADLPAFKVTLGGLNYFAEANILFPGTHTFRVDSRAGINIPHDLLLVGNIDTAPARP